MSSPDNEIKSSPKMQARLRIASMLIAAGLFAAAMSLAVKMPLGLLIFMGLAVMLSGLGMAVYLFSLVSLGGHSQSNS